MNDSIRSKSRQSAYLLIAILLTIVAVIAHRFLPERRLVLDTTTGSNYFLTQHDDDKQSKTNWVDYFQFQYTCDLGKDVSNPDCTFTYVLTGNDAAKGVDLSSYRTLNFGLRYAGAARQIRISIRNFDPRFSRVEDSNSPKYNYINLSPKDLAKPIAIGMNEFDVPDWWVEQYDLPRNLGRPDFSNVVTLSIDLIGNLPGTHHEIQIDKLEFTGDWISAESWYLGIMCAWMVFGTVFGVTRWLLMVRQQREQDRKLHELAHNNAQLQSDKEKYQKLSTIDSLTKVLNRHGIDQFIESLQTENLPTSIIMIDLDHFKRINDHRGHHIGDRVLQTMGEILRAHTRNTDGLGRWGGEEFILVCPGASLSKAADLAEKLRRKILDTNFIPEDPLSITASFGVSSAAAGQSFEEAFQQADQALYLAKGRGRNCVVAATDDQMHKVTGARKGTWALISGRFKLHS